MCCVSIIIPTNRSREALEPCLAAIAAQQGDFADLEVWLVFNGTREVCSWAPGTWPFHLMVDRIDRPHIGAAKNRALDRARGEWFIFLNDDMRVSPGFIQAHLAAHRNLDAPGMVLGRSEWRTWQDETLFDRMIQTTSMVFFYDQMQPHQWYGFRHAWNLNLSIHRRWLQDHRFAEELAPFFYEDIELAWRLERSADVRVWYAPEASGCHDHRYTLDGYLDRERRMGQASVHLWRCNPECFRAIYQTDLNGDHLAYCRRFVETEGRYEAQRIERLRAFVERRSTEIGEGTGLRDEIVQVLYDAHLPLKRLAFRRGMLDAVPDALAAPAPVEAI